jgi:hypothetical protein
LLVVLLLGLTKSFDDDDLICAHSFHKLLQIWKERFMNFEPGIALLFEKKGL